MSTTLRLLVVLIVTALLAVPAAVPVRAQSAALPQTYAITMRAPMGPGMTIRVARDGSKLSLEQIMPKSDMGPGMRIRQIYDFATHKYWTLDLEGSPCVVSTYTDTFLPVTFDPIGGSEQVRTELAKSKAAALRSETVNGIATKVYEMPIPEIKGRMRMFLEAQHNFPVKMVIIADGKEQTQMEITELSYAKPPASLFVTPQNCRVQAGESGASGGHAETSFDAKASGEVKLGEDKPAQKPAPRAPAAQPAARAPAPSAPGEITEVKAIGVQPSNYTGPAPASYVFTFAVTASGPIQADWVLVSQADTAWESGKIVFTAAGTKEMKVPVKIGVGNGQHWEGHGHLEVVVGEKRTASATIPVIADCRAK